MADPFVGTWKLNVAKSQFDENHRPTGGTLRFELDAEGVYLMTAEGTKPNGERVAERPQKFIPDGKPHPIPNLTGLSATACRPDANTIAAEARREDGSVAGGGTYTVSPDGKLLTASTFGFDTQLRQFKVQTVWDRQ